jgi:hypothetical protein
VSGEKGPLKHMGWMPWCGMQGVIVPAEKEWGNSRTRSGSMTGSRSGTGSNSRSSSGCNWSSGRCGSKSGRNRRRSGRSTKHMEQHSFQE